MHNRTMCAGALKMGIAITLTFAVSELRAQVRSHDPACASCRVTLTRESTLGMYGANAAIKGPLLGVPTRVTRSDTGYYYAAPTYDIGTVAVFDSTGRFVRTIGRHGEGPGELGEIADVAALRGDTFLVADHRQQFHIFTRSGEFIRRFRLGIPGPVSDPILAPNGAIVVQVGFTRDPSLRDPLIFFDTEGSTMNAVASPEPNGRWRLGSGNSGLWLARQNQYEIRLTDTNGNVVRSIGRDLEWFREPRAEIPAAERRGNLLAIAENEGVVWVIGMRRALPGEPGATIPRRFSEAEALALARESNPADSPEELLRTRTMFIDGFDVRDGRLLYSQMFPGVFINEFIDPRRIAIMRELGNGTVVVDVMRWSTGR